MPNITVNNDLFSRLQTAAERAGCSIEVFLTSLVEEQPAQRLSADFQEYLKVIHRAGIALDQLETLDELYRQAVEIGLNELGFDRVGLLLCDYKVNRVYGTYGTGEDGKIRDETHFQESTARDDALLTEALDHKDRILIKYDTDLYEYGQPFARGWNALVVLWDCEQIIGYIAVDNLIHKQLPRPYEAELLSLFGATVGHAIFRKRAELKLRASEERFRTLFQAAPVAALLVNPDGWIVSANQAAQDVFGYCEGELDSIALDTLVPESLHLIHRGREGLFSENSHDTSSPIEIDLELTGQRKDGAEFPIDVALGYFEGEGGLLTLAFIMDISERKIAEQQRIDLALQEERSTILNTFIRNSSHEFRTPLAIIHSSLFLLGSAADEAKHRELCGNIGRQADKILSLVENMTTMVRLENRANYKDDEVNINSVVLSVIHTLQNVMEEQKISLWLNLNEDISSVKGIRHDLAIAFSCLMDNAIRYTPEGGSIVVESKLGMNSQVVLSVIDTGTGMSTETKTRIFEHFYRADAAHSTPGLGLGLSIAKKIVDQHQGNIEVESIPGHGSTFRIIFPAPVNG